jgi:hypothetical protein
MRLLFVHYHCDHCDGLTSPSELHRGFILWSHQDYFPGREAYIFRNRESAERYRRAVRRHDWEIREVLCEREFSWHLGRGTVPDLELADRRFEIYPDHKFPPAPNRAYLAPREDAQNVA